MLSLFCTKLTECLTILLEVCRREVVHFVLLQGGIHLHARLEKEVCEAERL